MGYELEGDPRNAEVIIKALGLEIANGISAPGMKDAKALEGEGEMLDQRQKTIFQSLSAKANYMSADRPDLQFSCKEVCRVMGSPSAADRIRLKRIGRFLIQKPRLIMHYPWVEDDGLGIRVFSDTEWAGCRRTRRSTSGGLMLRGRHFIRSWSKTQATVALSSSEAEMCGVVKAAAEAIGVRRLGHDLGDT